MLIIFSIDIVLQTDISDWLVPLAEFKNINPVYYIITTQDNKVVKGSIQ
jgi:hypothetical protein